MAFAGDDLDREPAAQGLISRLEEQGIVLVGHDDVGIAVDGEHGDLGGGEAGEVVGRIEFLEAGDELRLGQAEIGGLEFFSGQLARLQTG